MSVAIWHDVECGAYGEDLPLWRALAAEHGDPVLDVGAGTGRVALDLARHGSRVTALDVDAALLRELAARSGSLPISTVVGDARSFALDDRFALCVVPMQTIQLLGGDSGRLAFLRCAREHLSDGGLLAVAIAEELEPFEVGDGEPGPLPDIRELDGVVYSSRAIAVREQPEAFALERIRETVTASGERRVHENVVLLDRLTAEQLESEALGAGFSRAGRAVVPATADYVGSSVVMLRA